MSEDFSYAIDEQEIARVLWRSIDYSVPHPCRIVLGPDGISFYDTNPKSVTPDGSNENGKIEFTGCSTEDGRNLLELFKVMVQSIAAGYIQLPDLK